MSDKKQYFNVKPVADFGQKLNFAVRDEIETIIKENLTDLRYIKASLPEPYPNRVQFEMYFIYKAKVDNGSPGEILTMDIDISTLVDRYRLNRFVAKALKDETPNSFAWAIIKKALLMMYENGCTRLKEKMKENKFDRDKIWKKIFGNTGLSERFVGIETEW